MSQTVTLTFTGRDGANRHVPMNRVVVTNLTRGWQETLVWPDTVLTMQNGVGIHDVETQNIASLQLSQNNPNPFNGATDVLLTALDAGAVTLEIADANGRMVEKVHAPSLQPAGTHQFRISLSVAGTYVMTARQNGKTSSIKMMCNEGGGNNGIEYVGIVRTTDHSPKSGIRGATNNPFVFGDQMEYVGYATINGTEEESQRILQAQGSSQTFVLHFAQTQQNLPSISTLTPTNVSSTFFSSGGVDLADNGAAITSRGVCWDTAANPTIGNYFTVDGTGTSDFISTVAGLDCSTTYYVRAYATNSVGISYGEIHEVTTLEPTIPEVSTLNVTMESNLSASVQAEVVLENCDSVSARGVCWNTTGTPTIADSYIENGTGAGAFTCQLTDLSFDTTYHVRAFAINGMGISYGEERVFTATIPDGSPCYNTPTVTDRDGNIYNTLQFGSQCWMKENLRTTKYADGTPIAQGNSNPNSNTAYWYYPNNTPSNKSAYGLLYTWKAVMRNSASTSANPSGILGICPSGWHVPSESEWVQLTDYIGTCEQYVCGGNPQNVAKALADTMGWRPYTNTCAIGNSPADNNASGFSAPPAGKVNTLGEAANFGTYSLYWTTTEWTNETAYSHYFYYRYAVARHGLDGKDLSHSVRCVRD